MKYKPNEIVRAIYLQVNLISIQANINATIIEPNVSAKKPETNPTEASVEPTNIEK